MDDLSLILQVVFYQSENNKEPVREWLKSLSQGEKKLIGEAIVQDIGIIKDSDRSSRVGE
jgi:hypothetical protein